MGFQNIVDFFVKKPLVMDKQRGHKFAVVIVFDYKNAKRDQVRSLFPAIWIMEATSISATMVQAARFLAGDKR